MKRGKQRSGSEHLSLSSGKRPDAFIRFGLLGGNCSCQLSSASSYGTKQRPRPALGSGRGEDASRVRLLRHRHHCRHPGTSSITRHRTASHGITQHHTVSHGITRHRTASHGISRHHTASHSITRHHTASHGITQHRTASHSTARPRTTRLVAHPHGPAADKAPGRHWAVQPTLRRCPHCAANGRTAMQSGRYKTGRCGAGSGAGPRSSAAGMAPSCRHGKGRAPRGGADGADGRVSGAERGGRGASADGAVCPRARKPLVEKKRRARINESLRELRQLLAGGEAKLENAEVLELTVRRVQAVLERRALEGGRLHREASERFAAGYIQCMHEVHTFVSGCPGIDGTTAAELLNHLLESMPLNEGGLRDLMADVLAEPWPGGEAALPPAEAALGPVLPAPSAGDETCSDSDEAEAEPGRTPAHGLEAAQTRGVSPAGSNKSMWRPW